MDKIKLKLAFAKYCLQSKVRKLQLGCGSNIIEGFFNTDIDTSSGAYFVDECQPLPFPDKSFHYIFSEHNFEHLSYHDGKVLLKECHRILKSGGKLRLTIPSIEFLIRIYEHPYADESKDYLKWHFENFQREQYEDFHGMPPAVFLINNFMRMWGHQTLYDKESIKKILEIVGFQDVKFYAVGESEDRELCSLESHQLIIPAKYNSMESLCLEAKKL